MADNKVIKTKDDVVAKTSDFVIEYKEVASFSKNYKIDPNILGEGAFGRVQKCCKKDTTEDRAVKIINKNNMSESENVRLKYEIDILKNLIHPNIVRLYEVYEDKNSIFLVTELCDGRELFDEIIARSRFIEQEAAIVTKQLLQAMAYCHEKNVAHRDLKPENILINYKEKGSIKVIDFGTSHVYDSNDHQMHQMYGTAYYIAPEVLAGNYTEKCDMWSIGVILYVMLSGKPPFNGKNDE
jgi:calcium-dependent protein kinase